ncbi:MAG: FAD-dependent oxidoreductase [Deltaproteobacteria bacterium]|nr:FAD-dependent oxidoreductase [Deltaproteobacteria bacterium]
MGEPPRDPTPHVEGGDRTFDAIVVGAGLSGLAAARRLVARGLDVLVVEARSRVGGRTLSIEHRGATFDLGGQWVGKAHRRVHALADELGLERFPQPHAGDKVLDLGGRISRYGGAIPSMSILDLVRTELTMRSIDRMTARVPEDEPGEAAEAAQWDATTVAGFQGSLLGRGNAKQLLDVVVRVVFGAEPSELSLLYFLHYLRVNGGLRPLVETEGGAQEARFDRGAQALALGLVERIGAERVLCDAPVRAVRCTESRVIVETDRGVFSSCRVILATPPHLVGRMRFEPPLPPSRDQFVQRQPMGSTVKVFAFYRSRTWLEQGLSGEAVVGKGPISVVYDDSSHDGEVACLLGFVVGRAAREWTRRSFEERRAFTLAEFERLLGAKASDAVDYLEHDWSSEPWSGGCPVALMGPDVMTSLGEELREPIGRVHFAGTETARRFTGYLEGAIEAAERVTDEVLAALDAE